MCGRRPHIQSPQESNLRAGARGVRLTKAPKSTGPLARQNLGAWSGRALGSEPARMLRQDATSASGDRQWGAHQDSSSRAVLCHCGSEGRRTQDGSEDRMGRRTVSQLERR